MARRLDPRPPDELRYATSARWVRARLDGVEVADSRRPLLVWEPRRPVPLYAFPRDDVRLDLLRPAEQAPERAHPLAGAWSVEAGGRRAEAAAWTYDDPDLADYVVLAFDAMDAWLEEDEEVFVHPRDPFHRIEVRASSRHVRVEADGTLLADSRRPVLLFETGLPTRTYLHPDDVEMELLEPSRSLSRCPYKGEARYWSVRAGAVALDDVAWSYPDPLPEVAPIAGLLAFYDERVDVTVDGERQERPRTPWSPASQAEDG
jgi:uncharacterized protein (DUF427 family)